MQYMLLIYGNEEAWEAATPDEKAEEYKRHRRFGELVQELGGSIISAAPLESTATATTIRGDLITDGPYVETKERLGGFYILEATDLDHVIRMARYCPSSTGGVEVRPIVDTSA
jgi:hypothetical protein